MTPHYEDEFDGIPDYPLDYDYDYDFDRYDDDDCDLCDGNGVILDYRYGIGHVEVTCPVCDGDEFY